tara:strand:+ start:70 stop:396 length:327 start_codon:yes stop_codon:yes gene_type:complete
MAKNVDDIIANLPKERQKRIEKRGQELIEEYETLQQLRSAQELTQVEMSKKLNLKQQSISKLEKRSDMMLSTLRGYVEAMGGTLDITVSFPDHKPVSLSGLGQQQETR